MAKKLTMMLVVGGTMAILMPLVADTETVGGYTWTYQINNDTAEIFNDYYSVAISPSPTGAVTIPSMLGGKPVTSIGVNAFFCCSGLTSVTIPNSVTSIGESAFCGCSGLSSVTIGNGVMSIGYSAFSGCSGLTSVTIPDSVTSIGNFAFQDCSGLTSVTIPDSVTSIGDSAFVDCSGLTSMTIPNSVTNIGWGAFRGCSGLTSVTILQCMSTFHLDYFYSTWSMSITNVIICNGVTSIIDNAFSSLYSLESVTIPDSVTSIGYAAFDNTPFYDNYPDGLVVFGKVAYKFKGSCPTSVVIPDSVTIIGNAAFCGCSGLTSVTIPDCVTSIEGEAFSGCSGLTSVTIPESVTKIGRSAFSYCTGLKEIIFKGDAPQMETATDEDVFYNVPSSCTVYVSPTSSGWNVAIPGIWDGKRIKYIGADDDSSWEYAVSCGEATIIGYSGYLAGDVVIPETLGGCPVTAIGKDALAGFPITRVTLPSMLRMIETPFVECEALAEIAVASGNECFSASNGVLFSADGKTLVLYPNGRSGEYVIPENVTTIADWAFLDCEALTGITVHAGVSSIGDGAFAYCPGLSAVEVDAGNVHFKAVEGVLFNADMSTLKCYPAGKDDRSTYVVPASVARLDAGAFLGCGALEGVILPLGIMEIPEEAFSECTGLREVVFGANVTNICDCAFGECKSLVSVTVPSRVAAIGDWAFNSDDSSMLSAYVPEGCEIGDEAFAEEGGSVSVTPYTSIRTVRFDTNDGVAYPYDRQVIGGNAVGMLMEPTREGFVFDGWFSSADCGERISSGTIVSGDVTYYAHWIADGSNVFGIALNLPNQEFITGGAAEWIVTDVESVDGCAMKSGLITHSQTSRIETVVSGAGVITFVCKVDGEYQTLKGGVKVVYDGLAFCIDGVQQGDLMGDNVWTTRTYSIVGDGSHTLSWLYVKDAVGDGGGEDCAWLDEVTWTPSAEAGLAAWLSERNMAADARVANGRTAAECYALGLDPTDATNDFRIVSIELVDGKPNVEWEPKTNRWTGAEIRAVLKGADRLEGPWAEVPVGGNPAFRFFKVVVELP